VKKALDSSGLAAEHLELEITEGLIMESVQAHSNTLNKFKDMGVHITIDDFGTGYSSLGCLKRLPIDTLKIDKSFIKNVTTDPDNAAIATAIVALGNSLRLNVLADGIANKAQISFLVSQGCFAGQGTFFSKPLPEKEFFDFLSKYKKLRVVAGN
jgi:EAL domain-containing protein (putative c-di-GMP-specific phosphodiesterase class I)